MKVVVVNAYNRHNGGDAALLSAALGQIRVAHPAAEIAYAGLEDPAALGDFEGAHNLGSIRRWAGDPAIPPARRWLRKAAALALFAVPRSVLIRLVGAIGPSGRPGRSGRRGFSGANAEPLAELRALAEADLVVGLGGGYFNGTADLAGSLNVAFLSGPLLLAAWLGHPAVLAPQSYGPFANPLQRALVRRALNGSSHVAVREDTSLAQLRAIGVDGPFLTRGVDSAFATSGWQPCADRVVRAQPVVGITARSWLSGVEQEGYERAIAHFIDWLAQRRGAVVRLIPQVTSEYRGDDDRAVSRRIARWCTSMPEVIEERLDHAELRASYATLDYLVGTRFHSVIFSLTSGVPAVAIEYEHKTSGIMTDLGLGEWVVPIRAVTAEVLIERFVALEQFRETYLERLDEVLPSYRARADEFVAVLRGTVG